jgi:hypothetical protein
MRFDYSRSILRCFRVGTLLAALVLLCQGNLLVAAQQAVNNVNNNAGLGGLLLGNNGIGRAVGGVSINA